MKTPSGRGQEAGERGGGGLMSVVCGRKWRRFSMHRTTAQKVRIGINAVWRQAIAQPGAKPQATSPAPSNPAAGEMPFRRKLLVPNVRLSNASVDVI